MAIRSSAGMIPHGITSGVVPRASEILRQSEMREWSGLSVPTGRKRQDGCSWLPPRLTVLFLTAGYFLLTSTRSGVSRGFAVVSIDLTNAGVVRGAEPHGDAPVAQLPRKLDEIHLKLPTFSRHGRYVVAILKSRTENGAVALGSAVTRGTEAQPIIVVSLDLSAATPGRYFLETRLEEASQRGRSDLLPGGGFGLTAFRH